jgi:phenylacetate-CoA ligase
MMIIRGVNIFPSQIETVILEVEEFEPLYFITVDRVNNIHTIEVEVELRPEFYSIDVKKVNPIHKKLKARLQNVLGIQVNIKIAEPKTMERSTGKAKRVNDRRKF